MHRLTNGHRRKLFTRALYLHQGFRVACSLPTIHSNLLSSDLCMGQTVCDSLQGTDDVNLYEHPATTYMRRMSKHADDDAALFLSFTTIHSYHTSASISDLRKPAARSPPAAQDDSIRLPRPLSRRHVYLSSCTYSQLAIINYRSGYVVLLL